VRPSTDPGARRAGGRYVLGDLLGRGGMAEVFAGHSIGDHGFQKPVAIKRLLPELASDQVFVERLISEAKLLVGMQHGNIVSVLDLARDGDDVFLVMEYVDGPSLRQLLKSRGHRGLPLGVATYIVQNSAAGLEFAHARPGGAVIHADISPSNLLLTTSGEVRVADFGIARREGGGHGIVEGKWAYMAPEQARGEPLTPRSDVFALGVVLYELICGAHPFGRQVTAEERDSEPMRVIPPRVVKPSIPHGIDAICMRALAHDPRDRYSRMQQLIDALVEERFSNGWREGASDLANAIRECSPQSATHQPRTMITDRPVTIVTRSLLKELTPVRRGSSPRVEGTPVPTRDSIPPIPDSGARTTNAILAEDILRAAALMELPPMLRADGTPMPPFRLSNDAMLPGQDLASVHGGHTVDGTAHGVEAVEGRSTMRWTIGVLAIAAVIGAIAAVAIQMGPSKQTPASDTTADQLLNPPMPAPTPTPAPAPLIDPDPPKPVTVDTVKPEETTKPVDPAAKPVDTAETAKPVDTTDGPKPPDTTEVAPPAPTPNRSPTRAPVAVKKEAKEPGILRVGAGEDQPWATVTIAGQKRQETPAKFSLQPGRYTVRLQNDDIGKGKTVQVVIESGKTVKIIANLEDN
jgi:serine/threonine-protein kinase